MNHSVDWSILLTFVIFDQSPSFASHALRRKKKFKLNDKINTNLLWWPVFNRSSNQVINFFHWESTSLLAGMSFLQPNSFHIAMWIDEMNDIFVAFLSIKIIFFLLGLTPNSIPLYPFLCFVIIWHFI